MRCFEVLSDVVRAAYDALECNERDEVGAAVERLSNAYSSIEAGGVNWEGPDFTDPVVRVAYLYKYVAYNAALMASIFNDHRDVVEAVFRRPSIKVGCLGGGPGSDVVGLSKFIDTARPRNLQHVGAMLLDRCPDWGADWLSISAIGIEQGHVRIDSRHQPCDVTEPRSLRYIRHLATANLITSLFFLSELSPVRTRALEFFRKLLIDCRPNTVFFYLDNDRQSMYGWFDELLAETGWVILAAGHGRHVVPADEQAEVLKSLDLGTEQNPRVQGYVAWAFARKEAAL